MLTGNLWELLKDRIDRRLAADPAARAGENIVDAELKRAKIAYENARTRKLGSDADMSDLQFIKEDEGYAHLERVELADIQAAILDEQEAKKHRYNLEQMYAQAQTGDKNIGVIQ